MFGLPHLGSPHSSLLGAVGIEGSIVAIALGLTANLVMLRAVIMKKPHPFSSSASDRPPRRREPAPAGNVSGCETQADR